MPFFSAAKYLRFRHHRCVLARLSALRRYRALLPPSRLPLTTSQHETHACIAFQISRHAGPLPAPTRRHRAATLLLRLPNLPPRTGTAGPSPPVPHTATPLHRVHAAEPPLAPPPSRSEASSGSTARWVGGLTVPGQPRRPPI